MVIKYHSQCPLMYFVYHINWTEISQFTKKLRTNLFWELFRWFESLYKAPILCEAFLHRFLMWLLKVSLLSIVTLRIFCSLLFFITKPLKISFIPCTFSKTHEMALPGSGSHVIFIKPFRNCIKISTQAILYFYVKPEAYKVLPSA